jgi:type I restriction enzyme S subunit
MSEVRRGYKQTEVGVIPEDWEVKTLRQISPSQSVGLVINPSTYFDDHGTIPILVGSSIGPNRISWESANRITQKSNLALPASRIYAGDLVTVRVGEPGITAVVPEHLDGCNCASMMIVRQHRSFNSQWLCYVMNSASGLAQVEHVQYGTAQKQFNISDAVNFSYPCPSLAEQEAIAEALSDADALIESLEQLLTKKRQIKQGAMQELLTGKKRLPGLIGEWKEKPLGKLGECYRGVSYNPHRDLSPFDTARTLRLLRSNNVQDAHIEFADMQFVDSNRVSQEQLLRTNDVLICMANGSRDLVGKAGRFAATDGFQYTFGAFMGCFRPDENEVDPEYPFWLFQTEGCRRQIAVLLAGSSINNLNPGNIKSLVVNVPSDKREQTAIATVLSDMEGDFAALESKLSKAQQLKQGMMQELLTGKTRLV